MVIRKSEKSAAIRKTPFPCIGLKDVIIGLFVPEPIRNIGRDMDESYPRAQIGSGSLRVPGESPLNERIEQNPP